MITSLADLCPGDIMFARRVRPLAADLLILAGQLFLGQPGFPHHVAVVTKAAGTYRDGPMIVQAMPSGAEEIEIGQEHWTRDYIYVRPDYESVSNAFPMDICGDRVAWEAREYIGTPYSFADYVAITGVHLGIGNGPVRRYVTSSRHMICSQLADQAMSDAGYHVFDDGRLPQDVTPAALFEKLMTMPGSYVIAGDHAGWVSTG